LEKEAMLLAIIVDPKHSRATAAQGSTVFITQIILFLI
jgi:hypothetical protein